MSDYRIVKRFLAQRCIGYLRDASGSITHSRWYNHVLYTDGTEGVYIDVAELPAFFTHADRPYSVLPVDSESEARG